MGGPDYKSFYLFMQILVTVVLATKALAGARAMLVSFLAVSTVLLMISGDKLLNVRDIARGNHINNAAGVSPRVCLSLCRGSMIC